MGKLLTRVFLPVLAFAWAIYPVYAEFARINMILIMIKKEFVFVI